MALLLLAVAAAVTAATPAQAHARLSAAPQKCGEWKFRIGYGPAAPGAPSTTVHSAAACCSFCHNTSGCKFWTWNGPPPGNGGCYAKAGNHSGGGSPSMISGGITPGPPIPPAPGPAPAPPPPPPPPPSPPVASPQNGFLNVTAPPFNVDNTGQTDVTGLLQAAIDYAYDQYLVVFFPHGTYLVSFTITFRTEIVYWDGQTEYACHVRLLLHVLPSRAL